MRYALIENDIVINVIVIEDESLYKPSKNQYLIQSDKAQIGNKYNHQTGEFEIVENKEPNYIQVYSVPLIKITDQTSTSSTLVADNNLQFFMQPNYSYYIEIFVAFSVQGILPIYQYSLTGPSSPTSIVLRNQLVIIGGTSVTIGTTSAYSNPVSTPSLTSGNGIIKIDGVIKNGDNSGQFNFNFARQSGTSVTTLAGSYLRYTYGLEV